MLKKMWLNIKILLSKHNDYIIRSLTNEDIIYAKDTDIIFIW